jgi:IclR family acetate operon transcriptional repressor
VKSADRSLALLELLAGRPEGLTFSEIAGALALPRSSAHGLLQTLRSRGYVEAEEGQGRERQFRLGLRVAELGAAYLRGRGRGLLERARAAVGELAARSGAAARLAVLDGLETLYLHAEEGEHDVRLASPAGRRLPAHATAEGKALLAGLPDAEVARRYRAAGLAPALPRLTPRTVDSLPALLAELRAVRALGHAHDVGEHTEGLHCVAAPVVDGAGAHQAALSVAVPTPQLDAERLVRLAGLVQQIAGRLSEAGPSRAVPPQGAAPASGGRARPPLRVAWSMAQGGAPYFGEIGRLAEQMAPALGAELVRTNAQLDHDRQVCDVRHLLALRPQVLVLHPVHTIRSDALFREAAAVGVPSICFRRPARSDAFALFAGGDSFQEGVLQIEWVAGRLGGRGDVALLEGDPYNDNARNIAEGNRHALSRYPGLRLVADEVCPEWSGDLARRTTEELLDRLGATGNPMDSGPGLHAVVCANDAMAQGVAETLAARGLTGRVLLVGGDGTRAAAEALQAGRLDATVFHDPALLAGETLRAAVALGRGTLDVAGLPRRSLAISPPSRPMPALDVPYRVIDRQGAAELAAFWAALHDGSGAAVPEGAQGTR